MKVAVLGTIDEKEYDALALHPVQTYAWGEIRKSLGTRILRLGVYEDEQLSEVYLMTLHQIPLTTFFVGYIPRSRMPSEAFLEALFEIAQAEHIIVITFEPLPDTRSLPERLVLSPYPLFYTTTLEIDLTKSLEELKADCSKKTRYNIGLALRSGIVIRQLEGEEAFTVFEKLYFGTAKRKQYGAHTPVYHQKIWETMQALGRAKMLAAFYEGEPLAVYELFLWGSKLYTPYSGGSPLHRELKAKNALLFAVIEKGKTWGATSLDMWGVAGANEKGKTQWSGFTEFKRGYGGAEKQFPGSFDFVVNPLFYKLYVLLSGIRRFFRKGSR